MNLTTTQRVKLWNKKQQEGEEKVVIPWKFMEMYLVSHFLDFSQRLFVFVAISIFLFIFPFMCWIWPIFLFLLRLFAIDFASENLSCRENVWIWWETRRNY